VRASTVIIRAGRGRAFRLRAGNRIRVGLPEGPQVADLFAFAASDMGEVLSTAHTRSCVERLVPIPGEAFYSSRRRPMLRLVEDNSAGVHDLLLSACDQERYRLLGHYGSHRSCADNLAEALGELGLVSPNVPSPVNLFENVTVAPDGSLRIQPPLAGRGDNVLLEAMVDAVVVLSACPMDIAPTNGADCRPKPIAVDCYDRL
jgi:uncharacterized protein